jgi:predicted secreted hydrolase
MNTKYQSTFQSCAANFFDTVADVFVGKASDLRNGTEHVGVELPKDLYAHEEAQTEWWYYTGHLKTSSGSQFGFELVFFKRRTDLDRFGVVPLRLIANPLYLAHFAITDEDRKSFRFEHRKSTGKPFDLKAQAKNDQYYLQLGNWKIRESNGKHLLRASMGEDLIFEASLNPKKEAVLNGQNGVSFKDKDEASRYFSYTRMEATGKITWHGKTEDFNGLAWMDREFGTWRTTDNQKGWDWFSIQFNTGAELMVYHLRNLQGQPSPFSSGTFVYPDGRHIHLKHEDFTLDATEYWTSPHTKARYPSGWNLKVPSIGIDVTITPVLKDQELDTRGTSMIVYWEGACNVTGHLGTVPTEGRAYAELVGYDRSHEQPSFTAFIFGSALDQRWRSMFG